MPITTNKSDLFRDEIAGGRIVDNKRVRGRTYTAVGAVTNASDDLNGSTFLLARIPSHAILKTGTRFIVTNWGFAAVRIGTKDDVDALVSQTQATENVIDPITDGDANHAKELWEVLGLASDPGGDIAIYAHAIADATGAGSMQFQIDYLDN